MESKDVIKDVTIEECMEHATCRTCPHFDRCPRISY